MILTLLIHLAGFQTNWIIGEACANKLRHMHSAHVTKLIAAEHTRSRHTVVCRAAQEAGAPHREYIDRKNENVIFTPLYLGDHLSDWNQICYTVARQPRESTFQI